MHKIYLYPPSLNGQTATFSWRVEPNVSLYRRCRFQMTFPPAVDLCKIPARLWWDVILICLHAHWLYLRPCEIHLPLKLGAPLRQFWLQHLRNCADTLDAYGPSPVEADNRIEIIDGNLDVPYVLLKGSGCGTAFSSGKDSLLQAALLFELSDNPLLVATTSPLPPLEDHGTKRRRDVFETIQKRRNPRFVEVTSDFRSIWDNSFGALRGFRIGVNEVTDTFLYTSSLLLAGAALGITRLFVASESELQDTALISGKIIQHSHFMYTAATQRSLARILAPHGLNFGSLTWPLHTLQVQQLLWRRYPDICDLQYSCWRTGAGQATCSQCEQCMRIAFTALASGDDPQRMGIDISKVIRFAATWEPFEARSTAPRFPQDDAADRLSVRVIAMIKQTSPVHLANVLIRKRKDGAALRDIMRTISEFRLLRRRPMTALQPESMGVREAYFDWLDSDLRPKLVSIYTDNFAVEPRRKHIEHYERSNALTFRATSCLD
jgi:hypothetical protein